jgi:hypothetical protein
MKKRRMLQSWSAASEPHVISAPIENQATRELVASAGVGGERRASERRINHN